MFVDGAWTASLSGETFTASSPATGEAIGEVPQGDRADAVRAIEAANRAADAWARLSPFDRAAALHRIADQRREPARRARAHADARPGQADPRVARRGRGARPVLAQRGRGRQAARGPARELDVGVEEGAAVPAAARRDRRDHAVELAVHDAGRADRARARRRQRRRLDARVDDRGRGGRARRVRRRGRPAGRRLQPRHRAGPDGRRRDRAQPGHARRRLHRLDGDRPQGRGGGRRQGRGARARRQRADRRPRRRRPRPRRRGDA